MSLASVMLRPWEHQTVVITLDVINVLRYYRGLLCLERVGNAEEVEIVDYH